MSRLFGLADRAVGRAGPAWYLLALWIALIGVQVPVPISNFRFSPSDVVLAALIGVILLQQRERVLAVARRRDGLTVALALLGAALLWGSAISLVRVHALGQEAWLNKDLGYFVLASSVVAIRTLVRGPDDVRNVLRIALTAGTLLVWGALLGGLVGAVAQGQSLTSAIGRFSGFLLNPSANGIFLATLVLIQLGSLEGRIVSWPRALQIANVIGLALLVLATLSRSTWLALLIVLVGLSALLAARRERASFMTAGLAVIIAIAAAEPFIHAFTPIFDQLAAGELGNPTRQVRGPVGTPLPQFSAVIGDVPVGTVRPTTPPAPPTTPPPTPVLTTTPPATAGSPGATATATPPTAPPTARPSPTPTPTPPPTPSPLPTPAPTRAELDPAGYARAASAVAQDRFGASDRLAIDVIALRLWVASPSAFLAGIGLGVFIQVTPYTPIGVAVIIHNSYLWLPVEMGIPGLIALVAILFAMASAAFALWRRADRDLALALGGTLALFAVWIAMNEGLSQRMLWITLSLASVIVTGPGWTEPLRRPAGRRS